MTIDVEKVLNELGKMNEYKHPINGEYTLFMLPDGRMVGEKGLVKHIQILGKALNKEIKSVQEFVNATIILNLVKLKINKLKHLHVNINMECTTQQIKTLKKLGTNYGFQIYIADMPECAPNAPNRDYYKQVLKMEL